MTTLPVYRNVKLLKTESPLQWFVRKAAQSAALQGARKLAQAQTSGIQLRVATLAQLGASRPGKQMHKKNLPR